MEIEDTNIMPHPVLKAPSGKNNHYLPSRQFSILCLQASSNLETQHRPPHDIPNLLSRMLSYESLRRVVSDDSSKSV